MKIGTFAIAAGVTALGLATWMTPGKAQGPLYDRVNVTLPYSVTIGNRTLQPGDYIIQQLRDAGGGSRVLLIYSDSGMKFETSAMTIPTLDLKTPESTKVVLHHFGPDYYFDKIWIQGKDYGYEFPLPDSVKGREKERSEAVNVAATYQSTQQNTETATNTKTTTTAAATTAATTPVTPPAETAPVTPVPETAPATPAPTMAQATPAPEPTPAPVESQGTANREMPATSAGWLMMLLSGGTLSGAGLMLRRKR